jgi:hypothetical protein
MYQNSCFILPLSYFKSDSALFIGGGDGLKEPSRNIFEFNEKNSRFKKIG